MGNEQIGKGDIMVGLKTLLEELRSDLRQLATMEALVLTTKGDEQETIDAVNETYTDMSYVELIEKAIEEKWL